MIDLSVDELRAINQVENAVNLRYMGKQSTLENLLLMVGELKERMADIGFIAQTSLVPTEDGGMLPFCDIVGRTDSMRAKEVEKEGYDFERIGWDARHTPSKELRKEGLNPDLLVG